MAQHIELIARGILHIGNQFLLCEDRKGGHCYLPGGHVEFGEGAREALAREFLEETGLRVRVGALVGVSEGTFVQKRKDRHEVNLLFHVELPGRPRRHPTVESREDDIAFIWATPSELRTLDLRPITARALLVRLAGPLPPPCGFDTAMTMKR